MGWPVSSSRSQSKFEPSVVARQHSGWFEDADFYGGARNDLPCQSAFDGAPRAQGVLLDRLRHSRGIVEDNWSVRGADHNLRVGAKFVGQEML